MNNVSYKPVNVSEPRIVQVNATARRPRLNETRLMKKCQKAILEIIKAIDLDAKKDAEIQLVRDDIESKVNCAFLKCCCLGTCYMSMGTGFFMGGGFGAFGLKGLIVGTVLSAVFDVGYLCVGRPRDNLELALDQYEIKKPLESRIKEITDKYPDFHYKYRVKSEAINYVVYADFAKHAVRLLAVYVSAEEDQKEAKDEFHDKVVMFISNPNLKNVIMLNQKVHEIVRAELSDKNIPIAVINDIILDYILENDDIEPYRTTMDRLAPYRAVIER